ncbi:unnamed protein product [Symbiodinium natans]|uniref:Uncharacterized protein n=1 Tax=Symbiodinium natans TaxID=878477 RepID=A0A812UB95_9DINO|nr:unnamed protein product [Symbiodinium natans]
MARIQRDVNRKGVGCFKWACGRSQHFRNIPKPCIGPWALYGKSPREMPNGALDVDCCGYCLAACLVTCETLNFSVISSMVTVTGADRLALSCFSLYHGNSRL